MHGAWSNGSRCHVPAESIQSPHCVKSRSAPELPRLSAVKNSVRMGSGEVAYSYRKASAGAMRVAL
jgi:hypothetical protein